MENKITLDNITSLAKRRGFIFPGSDVYGGMAGTWDFGPLGVMLKRKIMQEWWKFFVEEREDMFGVDAAIIMNPKTWVASGHAAGFSDPLVECKECHSRFRVDKMIGKNNPKDEDLVDFACPNCKKKNWDKIKQFNMMFKTSVGSVEDASSMAYLRPETAQGIFTNYKNVVDTIYPDLPFGLAQQGKAFRNEISPRDFIFRVREFEQMEIEYFIEPSTWEENFEKLHKACHQFLTEKMELSSERIHDLEVPEEDRAHYSKRTVDIEFDYPIGREELMGIAYRTDFDLSNIEKHSGKSQVYRDKNTGETFVPHVIEPSFGVERLVMAVLSNSYRVDKSGESERVVLGLPKHLAPFKFCVSPLLKNKPELVARAKEIYKDLKKKYHNVAWDDSGNIGKRYHKQDEIGTPYCVVIDFDTLEDGTVTLRDRDTAKQTRVKPEEL